MKASLSESRTSTTEEQYAKLSKRYWTGCNDSIILLSISFERSDTSRSSSTSSGGTPATKYRWQQKIYKKNFHKINLTDGENQSGTGSGNLWTFSVRASAPASVWAGPVAALLYLIQSSGERARCLSTMSRMVRIVSYKREYIECLAEEEENVAGQRSISLDRKQDCDWSIDSIE